MDMIGAWTTSQPGYTSPRVLWIDVQPICVPHPGTRPLAVSSPEYFDARVVLTSVPLSCP